MRSVPRIVADGCASGIFACRCTVDGRTRSMRPTAAFTPPTLDARPPGRKRVDVQSRRADPCDVAVDACGAGSYDPPAMRVVPLALRRDPLDVLASLAAEPHAFLLEVPRIGTTLLGCAPPAELRVLADGRVVREGSRGSDAEPLAAIERFVAEAPCHVPFPFGTVVGYLAYELGRFTEPPRDGAWRAPDVPLAVLARYDPVLAYRRGQYELVSVDPARGRPRWLERLGTPVSGAAEPFASG